MKVAVYFNLHKKTFSVKALEGAKKGRVIHHSDNVTLTDAIFKVSEAGRQRVLQEKRKNVHAYVIGQLQSLDAVQVVGEKITYNPYLYNTFVTWFNRTPVTNAKEVFMYCAEKRSNIFAR